MVSLAQLWLPILLGAVGAFVASSILHMVLQGWHRPDYHNFLTKTKSARHTQEQPKPGMYMLPWCPPEKMKDPAMHQKFVEVPGQCALQ